ncbi:MAG: WD40 repeat domain-containing protein [Planctomycetota bacterium]
MDLLKRHRRRSTDPSMVTPRGRDLLIHAAPDHEGVDGERDRRRRRHERRTRRRRLRQGVLRVAWAAGLLGFVALISTATWMVLGGRWDRGTDVPAAIQPQPTAAQVFDGDSGAVHGVSFNATGTAFAAGLGDGSLRVWNLQTGQIDQDVMAHEGRVWSVRYHPTRPLLVTSGDDGTIKLWETFRLRMMRQWNAESAVRSVAFSSDGDLIAAGDAQGTLVVWNVDSGEEVVRTTQSHSIDAVSWSKDGKWIASVGSDKVVRLWESGTLGIHQTLSGHRGPIDGVAFVPSDGTVVTVGWGETIHLWDPRAGVEAGGLDGQAAQTWSVAVTPDSSKIIAAGDDGVFRIWDRAARESLASVRAHDSAIHALALNRAGSQLLTGGRDGTIRLWNLRELLGADHSSQPQSTPAAISVSF